MPSTGLILDALNPPSPAELVADLEQVGAVGFAFYALRRSADGGLLDNGTVTKAHIDAVQESGRFAFPICVPGNNPQPDDAKRAIDNALAMDVDTWLMIFDLESFSLPPGRWLADAIATCHRNAWVAGKYGDTNVVVQYVLSDGDWFSHGRITVHRNQLQPMPALPADAVGDQYTVGVIWNGHEYDGSVFDLDFLTAATHGPGPADGSLSLEEDDEMVMITPINDDGTPAGPGYLVIGGRAVEIPPAVNPDVDDTRASQDGGVTWLHYSAGFVANIVNALNGSGPAATTQNLAPHTHENGPTGPAVADPPAPVESVNG